MTEKIFPKNFRQKKSYRVTELQGYRLQTGNFPKKILTEKIFPKNFRQKKVTELQSYRATDPKKFPAEKKLQSYRVTGLQTQNFPIKFLTEKKLQSYKVTGLQTRNNFRRKKS